MYGAETFGVVWNINHIRSLWFKSRESDNLKHGIALCGPVRWSKAGHGMVRRVMVRCGLVMSGLVRFGYNICPDIK